MGILDLILAEPGGRRAQMLPPEMNQADIRWHQSLYQLTQWREKNVDSWPSRLGDSPEEKRLGIWLSNQRSAQKGGGFWNEEREDAMNAKCLGWAETPDDKWSDTLAALSRWRRDNEARWPGQTSSDSTERRLGKWLVHQRSAYRGKGEGRWSKARQDAMDAACPGWSEGTNEAWTDTLARLEQWRAENEDAWPSHAGTAVEKQLAKWLGTQRAASRGKKVKSRWSEQRAVALETACPGWMRDASDAWTETLMEVVGWRAQHEGSWPKTGSTEPTERRLGYWLSNQRAARKGNGFWSIERETALDAACPGWVDPAESAWLGVLAELVSWRAENEGKLPRLRSSAPMEPTERRLGVWLGNQRSAYKGGAYWSEERQTALDKACPDWKGKIDG